MGFVTELGAVVCEHCHAVIPVVIPGDVSHSCAVTGQDVVHRVSAAELAAVPPTPDPAELPAPPPLPPPITEPAAPPVEDDLETQRRIAELADEDQAALEAGLTVPVVAPAEEAPPPAEESSGAASVTELPPGTEGQ